MPSNPPPTTPAGERHADALPTRDRQSDGLPARDRRSDGLPTHDRRSDDLRGRDHRANALHARDGRADGRCGRDHHTAALHPRDNDINAHDTNDCGSFGGARDGCDHHAEDQRAEDQRASGCGSRSCDHDANACGCGSRTRDPDGCDLRAEDRHDRTQWPVTAGRPGRSLGPAQRCVHTVRPSAWSVGSTHGFRVEVVRRPVRSVGSAQGAPARPWLVLSGRLELSVGSTEGRVDRVEFVAPSGWSRWSVGSTQDCGGGLWTARSAGRLARSAETSGGGAGGGR
ncbi:hypothetical protein GCM10022222_47810 [Amycolatopsis ultiminotia]|uniref:Uncharacterized protein n=1 Tax=Amycolatopsis ultiminotia TaxID=543629 RepID=A0ABP6X0Z5_9PSEU